MVTWHACADMNGNRPDPGEQTIPSYNDFHADLNMVQKKGKAYFHMLYNQPTSKSVVHDIMEKLSIIIAHALCFLSGGSSCVCSHHPAKG